MLFSQTAPKLHNLKWARSAKRLLPLPLYGIKVLKILNELLSINKSSMSGFDHWSVTHSCKSFYKSLFNGHPGNKLTEWWFINVGDQRLNQPVTAKLFQVAQAPAQMVLHCWCSFLLLCCLLALIHISLKRITICFTAAILLQGLEYLNENSDFQIVARGTGKEEKVSLSVSLLKRWPWHWSSLHNL